MRFAQRAVLTFVASIVIGCGDATRAPDPVTDGGSDLVTNCRTGDGCECPLGGLSTCFNGACFCAGACDHGVLGDINNCGSCGAVCSVPANTHATCREGVTCGSECDVGFFDCDGDAVNGCETSSQADVNNCGGCGNTCGVGQSCIAGSCFKYEWVKTGEIKNQQVNIPLRENPETCSDATEPPPVEFACDAGNLTKQVYVSQQPDVPAARLMLLGSVVEGPLSNAWPRQARRFDSVMQQFHARRCGGYIDTKKSHLIDVNVYTCQLSPT